MLIFYPQTIFFPGRPERVVEGEIPRKHEDVLGSNISQNVRGGRPERVAEREIDIDLK